MAGTVQKQVVYLETSFVSYLTGRVSGNPQIALNQAATRRWWDEERGKFALCTSALVVKEASRGDTEQRRFRADILGKIEILPATAEAEGLARKLLAAKALPKVAEADAFHVAVAAAGGADYLLTWNCRHIANPDTLPAIQRTIAKAGFNVPVITTPGFMLESRQ